MRHLTYISAVFLLLLISGLGIIISAPQEIEAKASLSFVPEKVMQGEPLQIVIKGVKKNNVIHATFSKDKEFIAVPMTYYDKKFVGFVPIDINKKPGTYTIQAMVKNNEDVTLATLTQEVEVVARIKQQAPLGIPQKLGGNTAASQKQLVDTLAMENQSLVNLGTAHKALWKKAFTYPVKNPVVTDPYGYSRLTGNYTITHKGTDFRAPTGTEIYAVNDGVVVRTQLGRNYGNTIVIDHGNGIQSFYMHLSEMKVSIGDKVKRGQLIGLSGQTGYAESPHLHFTLRINDISIDPMVFLKFFE